MKVVTYNGKDPIVIPSSDRTAMLDIMQSQLRIIEQMAMTVVMIPAGTTLREETLKEPNIKPKMCCYCNCTLEGERNLIRSQHGFCHPDCWDKKQGSEGPHAKP